MKEADPSVLVGLIGAMAVVAAALIAGVVTFFQTWFEKTKLKTNLALEARRIENEERRWARELHSKLELRLHRLRLQQYPEVFADLALLSHHRIVQTKGEELRQLADRLNAYGYGKAGLCMLPDTREAVFTLRNDVLRYADGRIAAEQVLAGSRTDLIELLRRDLNHNWSPWRRFQALVPEAYDPKRSSKGLQASA